MSDLPDNTKQTSVNVAVTEGQENIPRPKGGILQKGSATSTASYVSLVSVTVTDGEQFQLSKIMISAQKAVWVKWQWNGIDISAERLIDDKGILFEHFPWDYKEMLGDGAKKFDVLIKWETEAGTINGEIVGEEYTP